MYPVGHDTVCWLLTSCFPSGRIGNSSLSPTLSAIGATKIQMYVCYAQQNVRIVIKYTGGLPILVLPALAAAAHAHFNSSVKSAYSQLPRFRIP